MKLVVMRGDTVTMTRSGMSFRKYLLDNIDDLQNYSSVHDINAEPREKEVKKIGVIGHNPFTARVIPEFLELLNSNSRDVTFKLISFHNTKDAADGLSDRSLDFGVFVPQSSIMATETEFSGKNVCSIANLYPLRFAMITNYFSNVNTLTDLRGKKIAGIFPKNAALQYMTKIYTKSARTSNEKFHFHECDNIKDSFHLLSSGKLRATVFPLDALRSEDFLKGRIRLVTGELSEESEALLTAEYPSGTVLKHESSDDEPASVIQIPLMIFGQTDERPDTVEFLIDSAIRFFKRLARHRLDGELSDDFFDPGGSGIRQHLASREFFNPPELLAG